MSTNYPDGIDSYTEKNDGVDTVSASDINDLQDAVEAIETELGTNPKESFSNVASAITSKLSTTGGTLTGNVSCSAGVTVDGVDISAHDHSGGTNGTAIPEIVNARENETDLITNLARRGNDWVCNAVNFSSTDANGMPNYLSVGTGLAVNVSGATTSIKMDISGYYQHIISDTSISSLTASSTCWLYAEKASSGFVATLGHSVLQPVYSYIAPGSPSTDQHWFDLSLGVMKRYTGSAWETKDRIFIGKAITGSSTVTSVTAFALKGRYESGWFAVSANTKYDLNHNLGLNPLHVELFGATSSAGANCHRSVYFKDGPSTYGGMVWNITDTGLSVNDNTSGFDNPIRYGASTSASSGYYRVVATRGF